MAAVKSYVVWNNKGGVGKTTLCFHIATRYAYQNPNINVLAIDMCPQANLSSALLTGDDPESGIERVRQISSKGKSVAGYLSKKLEPEQRVDPSDYLIGVHSYNSQIAENLSLICGDPVLEYVGKHIEHRRQAQSLPTYDPWKMSTLLVKQMIDEIVSRKEGQWFVIIDTNPTFNVYTELAIVAAQRLLVPINADDFSTRGLINMFEFLYGKRILPQGEESPFERFRNYSFSEIATTKGIGLPKVHLLISNRTTTYDTRTATAWRATTKRATEWMIEFFRRYPDLFTDKALNPNAMTLEDFTKSYQEDLQDFHTLAVLCIYSGTPMHFIRGRRMKVYAETVTGSLKKRAEGYGLALDTLLGNLV